MKLWPLLMTLSLLAESTVYIGTRTREGRSEGIYRVGFDPASGKLGKVELAAAAPDPSFLAVHPSRPLLYAVAALPEGEVLAYAIESGGNLKLLNRVSSKGAGPAHIQIDRTGKWLAIANYSSGSVATYRIEADGRLSEAVDTHQHAGKGTHPTRQEGPHAHSVYFSADNKVLYAADLGLDQVKVYGFDGKSGKLTPGTPLQSPAGAGPRHLALGKKRIYVLNELASSLSVFENGRLVETQSTLPAGFQGESTAAEVVLDQAEKTAYASNRGSDTIAVFRTSPKLEKIADVKVGKTPRNFVLSPDGRFLLVASQAEDTIQSFRVDAGTGLLSPIEGVARAGSPICLRFARP